MRLVVEPEFLPLLYPKASAESPIKLRLVAQVHHYDPVCAVLAIQRFPNLPQLVISIDLEHETPPTPQPVEVNVSHVISQLAPVAASGRVVNIIGTYDGRTVTAFECTPVDERLVIEKIGVIAQLSNLCDF